MRALSVVIPLCNEEGNVEPLFNELHEVLIQLGCKFELVFVNDGSTDQTQVLAEKLAEKNPCLKLVNLSENMGQGMAIFNGIQAANYDLICTLDGDRQFYPEDLKNLYQEFLNQKVDMVCGKRAKRNDDKITKTIPSFFGNKLIAWVFGTKVEDIGCSLKIVPKPWLTKVKPFKNYHRYLSIFLILHGASFLQLDVKHKARESGKTKYSPMKFFGVILELLWIKFFYLKGIKKEESRIEA